MDTFTVTATQLRTDAADILNRVYYEQKIALIERHGDIIARVSPEPTSKKDFNAVWNSYAGAIPGIPDVKKFRTSNSHRFKATL